MSNSSGESPPANFSQLKPPHVFRPVESSDAIAAVLELTGRLKREQFVRKAMERLRLDTLFVRETRLVSHLGQAAIDKYLEALKLLGPRAGWDQPVTVGVSSMTANHRKGGTGNRIIMQLEPDEQLEKERDWALEITRRMTGQQPPRLFFKRDITVGMLAGIADSESLQKRLDAAKPDSVTLLPTIIQYTAYKRLRPERLPG